MKNPIVIDWVNVKYEAITNTNAKMTVVPAYIFEDEGYSRVLFLKINGKVKKILFTMYKTQSSSIDFSGYIIIRSLNMKFLRGFNIKKGKVVAKLQKRKKIQTKGSKDEIQAKWDKDCCCYVIDGEVEKIGYRENLDVDDFFTDEEELGDRKWIYGHGEEDEDEESRGGSNSPKTDQKTEEVIVDDIKGTKVECVKEKLEAGGDNSLIEQLLKGFNLEESKLNVVYKIGDIKDSNVGGNTRAKGLKIYRNKQNGTEYVKGDIIITIDLDCWMNKTSIGLAYTVLHETLHACLFGQRWAKRFHENAGGVEVNFEEMFKEYKTE